MVKHSRLAKKRKGFSFERFIAHLKRLTLKCWNGAKETDAEPRLPSAVSF